MAYLAQLRLDTPLGAEGSVEIPAAIADPRQVVVYYSAFDAEGFLDFLPLNGCSGRHGQPDDYYPNARDAYRALWKEEFAGIPVAEELRQPGVPLEAIHPSLAGLTKAIELARAGRQTLAQLHQLVRDVSSPPQLLNDANATVAAIDRHLEEVSLAYPILGAIIRIFIMEKENLRGDDPLQLISETDRLYENLVRRSERFGSLYAHYAVQRGGSAARVRPAARSLPILSSEQHESA
ncbi:MAG: hypothetical protein KDD69_09070 [Bdellovibrionales bacterium]|nr:hypothetical protein [Bdellovibrionales bacterium]